MRASGGEERATSSEAQPSEVERRAAASERTTTPSRRQLLVVSALTLALFLPGLASTSLWDPWETHYAEVARRMLQDGDFVRLNWQDEAFRSKPVFTFWLIAAGMGAFGVADDGGYSGELVSTPRVEWGVRLPFALFGCAGIVCLFWALQRLGARRAAWLAAAVLATSPFYFFITRQAITDMPSCALLIATMALFAVAVHDDRPLASRRAVWIFAGVLVASVGIQLAVCFAEAGGGRFLLGKRWHLPGWLPLAACLPGLAAALWWLRGTTSTRQVHLLWFYYLNGVAVLAKGPVAPALAGLTILGYLAVTGEWRRLRDFDIPRGVLIAVLVCLPWHLAIYILDGKPWLDEYVGVHLLGRTFLGTYGDRGTFLYYVRELGYGMWPWVCLVPGALVALLLAGRPRTRDEKVRALFVVWAVVGFAFFAFVRTKFHHYVLPLVPAFAAVMAFWLDGLLEGRGRAGAAAAIALALLLVTGIDLAARQEELVHLFCFKYDRPWPYADPWNVDLRGWIIGAAAAFGAALALFAARRRAGIAAMVVAALAFTLFGMHKYIVAATPHWGMRALLERYYRERKVHGVDLVYDGPGRLVADLGGRDLVVPSVIPSTLQVGDPMVITWKLGDRTGSFPGAVSSIDAAHDRFVIRAEPDAATRALVEQNRGAAGGGRRLAVNADRLIAWQLRWRGENFYSGGEIWNPPFDDMKTVFVDVDNKKFGAWARERVGSGRTYFLITEIERVKKLEEFFGTLSPRPAVEEIDRSNNKYGIVKFTL